MNDLTAREGVKQLEHADTLLANRRLAASFYRDAISGCDWLTPQFVPDGWTHDYWCYPILVAHHEGQFDIAGHPTTIAVSRTTVAHLQDVIVKHGGERPYGAWRLTYQEPAFRHLAPDGTCPVAESLQPRILQMATNRLDSAERNATALAKAIRELG